jgi:DNA polymerase III epsilon subunit-like protein
MNQSRNIKRVLVFDVETTGLLPKKGQEVPVEELPHVIQLSYVIFETSNWRVSKEFNHYINIPQHVVISSEITEITGINRDMCNKGITMDKALEEFCEDYMICDTIVAHNIYFDRRMIQLEISRHRESLNPFHVEKVFLQSYEKEENKQNFCTMYKSKNICKIERKDDKGETYYKSPKLSELYEHLFETKAPLNLHDSLIDTYVCLRCFVKMRFKFDISTRGYKSEIFHHEK